MVLSNALDSEHKQNTALAATAVWALLHNCVKVGFHVCITMSYTVPTVDLRNVCLFLCSQIKNILRRSELSSKLQSVTASLTPGI